MKHDRRNRHRRSRAKHKHRNRIQNSPCGCEFCYERAGISDPTIGRQRNERAAAQEAEQL